MEIDDEFMTFFGTESAIKYESLYQWTLAFCLMLAFLLLCVGDNAAKIKGGLVVETYVRKRYEYELCC